MGNNVSIIKKRKCFGCYACVNSCPRNCISMRKDEEGFQYPWIDYKKCIICGNCIRSCPSVNKLNFKEIRKGLPTAYSTYALDEEICKQSSSGGIFSLFANYVLSQQGVIYGAVWAGHDYVKHIKAITVEELFPLRKSKYLQSDTGLTFREVKKELEKDKKVLYVGTPCQIAGLHSFLRKDYNELITVDLICMGVQSPNIFNMFLREKEVEYKKKPVSYYRDKSKGWAPVVFTMDFENGESIYLPCESNEYHHGFKARLFIRPSCDFCRFAKHPRTGDITLGDDWDYYEKHKNEFDKLWRGVSYISVNTEKGMNILKQIEPYCSPLEKARLGVGWQHKKNFSRKAFWKYIKNHTILESVEKFVYHKSFFVSFLEKILMTIYFISINNERKNISNKIISKE